jgi:hypothetical protein
VRGQLNMPEADVGSATGGRDVSKHKTENGSKPIQFEGRSTKYQGNHWKANNTKGMRRLAERGKVSLWVGKTLVFK